MSRLGLWGGNLQMLIQRLLPGPASRDSESAATVALTERRVKRTRAIKRRDGGRRFITRVVYCAV